MPGLGFAISISRSLLAFGPSTLLRIVSPSQRSTDSSADSPHNGENDHFTVPVLCDAQPATTGHLAGIG
jgi:hypothetical protein